MHTGAGDLNRRQQANPEFAKLLKRLASVSINQRGDREAMAELLARAGHHHRHGVHHPRHNQTDGYEEQEDKYNDKPWYYHDREDDKPAYRKPTEDNDPAQHSYKDSQDNPYGSNHGHDHPPAHGSYPPPGPVIPLIPSTFTYVDTFIEAAEGKANATGDLTQGEDYTRWSEELTSKGSAA